MPRWGGRPRRAALWPPSPLFISLRWEPRHAEASCPTRMEPPRRSCCQRAATMATPTIGDTAVGSIWERPRKRESSSREGAITVSTARARRGRLTYFPPVPLFPCFSPLGSPLSGGARREGRRLCRSASSRKAWWTPLLSPGFLPCPKPPIRSLIWGFQHLLAVWICKRCLTKLEMFCLLPSDTLYWVNQDSFCY